MKTCSNKDCKENNPQSLDSFYERKASADGLNAQCKSCIKRYQQTKQDHIRQKRKERYWKNPEQHREYAKKAYHKDPEKWKERVEKWRENNPDKVYEAQKNWRKNNAEKHRKANREWEERNKDKVKEMNRRKRFKKYGITESEYKEILIGQDNKCCFCSKDLTNTKTHIDHCHVTNKVRRILCSNCNTTYGQIYEQEETLRKMLEAAKEDTSYKKVANDEEE